MVIFFGSWVTKITKHHFQPTTIVEELLLAHPTDDAIWDNINPCDVSFDNTDGTEIASSIDVTKELTVTTTIFMSIKDDKPWFDANEEFDLWYKIPETWTITKNGKIYQSLSNIQVSSMNP